MFPAIRPYTSELFAVGEPHALYVEQSGNPNGIPVVFLHGGPGGGCSSKHRQFFDPQRYRIVLFDQRGAGQSTPHASLDNNTTAHLISDIEAIRQHLGIEQWLVFGGSWGSSLGLAYAEAHPDQVLGLILRGIFLCRSRDVEWFYQEGASRLFPEYWQDFLAPVAESQRHDMVSAYHALLTGEDEVARMRAAEAWSLWEGRTSTLKPNAQLAQSFAAPFSALAMARIECHYFRHASFMRDNQLLKDAHRLADIPTWIVHGRYDSVCPVEQAYDLGQAMPHAHLQIIDASGHSAFEPDILAALIAATESFADQYA